MSPISHKKIPSLSHCQLTGKEYPIKHLASAQSIREPICQLIKQHYPDWNQEGYRSFDKLREFRTKYLQNLMTTQNGDISDLEKVVLQSEGKAELLSTTFIQQENTNNDNAPLGERTADKVAEFGGSWKFIICFLCFMAA
jgi:hypothetical protein